MKRKQTAAAPAIIGLWIWAVLSFPAIAGELTPVTFLPQWSPQSQFAGYYVAQAKEFYKQQGLSVNILHGGPGQPAGPGLATKKTDFATLFLTDGIALRDQGVPLVNVAQIVQRSALMLVARKKSGIETPADFEGKRVSVWDDFRLQPQAFFRQNQVDVTIISQGYTVNLFLMGGVDAASAMWYNEYYAILNAGIDAEELKTFLLADHGLNFPEDGIYCRQETLMRNPETVKAFVRASIRGWQYAFDHREEALDIVMARVNEANLPTNRVHQEWMLARMQDIIVPENNREAMGSLNRTDFEFVARQLKQRGITETIPEYGEFYEPVFQRP